MGLAHRPRREKLLLYAAFTPTIPLRDLSWALSDDPTPEASVESRFPQWLRMTRRATREVLCGPGGSVAQILLAKAPYFSALPEGRRLCANFLTNDLHEIKEPDQTMRWERCTYRLSALFVLSPMEVPDGKLAARRFLIVAASVPQAWGENIRKARMSNAIRTFASTDGGSNGNAPRRKGAGRTAGGSDEQLRMQLAAGNADPAISWEFLSGAVTSFEARSGQVNEFTIPLPDALTKLVRRKLANPETPCAELASTQDVVR